MGLRLGKMAGLNPSRNPPWNSLAAYVLIKGLGWMNRERDSEAILHQEIPSAETSSRLNQEESKHGLLGWWALLRDAATRWINHKAARLGAALAYYSVSRLDPSC